MKIINPYKMFVGSFIPNFIMKSGLTNVAKLTYAKLSQYSGMNGICYPSIETLSKELNCSQRAVISSIKELQRNKLILKTRKGRGMNNEYVFLEHEWMQDFRGAESQNPESTKTETAGQQNKESLVWKQIEQETQNDSEEIKQLFREWYDYRKEIRKPITSVRTIRLSLKCLRESSNPKAMVEKSIQNGWQGLFPEHSTITNNKQNGDNGKQEFRKTII